MTLKNEQSINVLWTLSNLLEVQSESSKVQRGGGVEKMI